MLNPLNGPVVSSHDLHQGVWYRAELHGKQEKKIPDQNHNNVAAAVSVIKDEFVQGHTMNVDTYI